MTVCSFNMHLTWIWLGWEGSAHDWRIFTETMTRPDANFHHHLPSGKYYLVDAGYPNTSGCLGAYNNCKYHLQTYRRRRPRRAKEIFNHAYSSLRNMIKRCFGVLKARFSNFETLGSMLFNYSNAHCCCMCHFAQLYTTRDTN